MPLPQNPWTLDRLTVPDTALVLSPLFAEYLLWPQMENYAVVRGETIDFMSTARARTGPSAP